MLLTRGATAAASLEDVSEQPGRDDRDDEVLPEQTADDTDRGWGERTDEDDDERLIREKPPHW